MRIAITGGTGFVGRHLAYRLVDSGHKVVLVARGNDDREPGVRELEGVRFFPSPVAEEERLVEAFQECDGIAHCAGINREIGKQTYLRVHVEGTRAVVNAARKAGVRKIAMLSFLRARPDCGSPYHESKWEAEEILRSSGLDFTVLKAGLIYGKGDHMLDHLGRALLTFPVFALVGMKNRPIRPTAVEDVVRVLEAALAEDRLSRRTVSVVGPEEIPFSEIVRRVSRVVGKHRFTLRLPLFTHYLLAWCFEQIMTIPLVSLAQVRILSEGITDPAPGCEQLPDDLLPSIVLTEEQIRKGLPELSPFGKRDCLCFTEGGLR